MALLFQIMLSIGTLSLFGQISPELRQAQCFLFYKPGSTIRRYKDRTSFLLSIGVLPPIEFKDKKTRGIKGWPTEQLNENSSESLSSYFGSL